VNEPAKRVRITHPRTEAARRVPSRPTSREIDEQTPLGEVYMSSLIRSQRRLGVIVCAAIAVLLVGIALLGAVAPRFATLHLFGLPLPWVILGGLIYPVLIGLAAYTVRQAERNERAFTELLRRR
jgi:fatty acid desaturase